MQPALNKSRFQGALLPAASRPKAPAAQQSPPGSALEVEPRGRSHPAHAGHPAQRDQLPPLPDASREALLDAIRNAKHSFHIETFIWHNDESGNEIIQALAARKAQAKREGRDFDVKVLNRRVRSARRFIRGQGSRHRQKARSPRDRGPGSSTRASFPWPRRACPSPIASFTSPTARNSSPVVGTSVTSTSSPSSRRRKAWRTPGTISSTRCMATRPPGSSGSSTGTGGRRGARFPGHAPGHPPSHGNGRDPEHRDQSSRASLWPSRGAFQGHLGRLAGDRGDFSLLLG